MANIFLDLESGSDGADGTSFANRVLTLTRACAVMADGDDLRIKASSDPNSLGVNGTFVRGSTQITLASAVNATLDQGESAWTASANVTTTTSTTRKQGATSASVAIGAAFATGLAAFKALGASTDLSAYQQISFWMQQTAGTLAANCSIRICSDTVGATSVNTFTIPACGALNAWHRVTINLGSAMSAVAQSIALYIDSDPGAQTFLIGRIIACKAPGTGELTFKTLIGKLNSLGAGGDDSETWYAIRDINGTIITLEAANSNTTATNAIGMFWGTSETVTAYSMLPSYLPVGVATTDVLFFKSGTSANHLTISGGWNRTDMSTQTGHTWAALPNTNGAAPSFYGSYFDISNLHFAMIANTNIFNLNNSTFAELHLISCAAVNFSGSNNTFEKIYSVNANGSITCQCILSVFSNIVICSYVNTVTFSASVAAACSFAIDANTNNPVNANTGNVVTYNGVTYGLNGPAAIATVLASDFAALPTTTEFEARTLAAASYSTAANLATVAGYLDTEIGDIKAKTDQLTFTVANQVDANALSGGGGGGGLDAAGVRAAIGMSAANLDTQLGTIDDFLDTEVGAIKAKTDNLPVSPAATGDIPSAATNATAVRTELGTELARIDAAVSTRLATSGYTAPLTAATTRDAVGLASANLDTQLAATASSLASLAVKFTGITLLKNWLGSLLGKTADTGTRAEINATTAGATYNETTDSLQAIRDRGDSAWGSAGNVDVGSFTAGALAQLAALDNINVLGGRVRNGVIILQIGDAYTTDDGTQLIFANAAGSWPELTDANLILRISTAIAASIDVDGEVIVATGANQRVDVELTEAATIALKAGKWKYELIAELTSGNRSTIESGVAEVSAKL